MLLQHLLRTSLLNRESRLSRGSSELFTASTLISLAEMAHAARHMHEKKDAGMSLFLCRCVGEGEGLGWSFGELKLEGRRFAQDDTHSEMALFLSMELLPLFLEDSNRRCQGRSFSYSTRTKQMSADRHRRDRRSFSVPFRTVRGPSSFPPSLRPLDTPLFHHNALQLVLLLQNADHTMHASFAETSRSHRRVPERPWPPRTTGQSAASSGVRSA